MQAGDHKQALALHEKLLPIWNAISTDNLPANVKYCMELMGRPAGLPRPPMPPTAEERKPLIRKAMEGAGAI
jgi:4-hydroxy-tetrahydrodipicolinate synthase